MQPFSNGTCRIGAAVDEPGAFKYVYIFAVFLLASGTKFKGSI